MKAIIDTIERQANTVKSRVSLLNARLAEAIDLGLMAKQAHWNLKGPSFFSLHKLFDEIRAQLDTHADALAERVVQQGGDAQGTVQAVVAGTSLDVYPADIHRESVHIAAYCDRLGMAAERARASIAETDEAGAAGTADILTAYSLMFEKSIWLVNSHAGTR